MCFLQRDLSVTCDRWPPDSDPIRWKVNKSPDKPLTDNGSRQFPTTRGGEILQAGGLLAHRPGALVPDRPFRRGRRLRRVSVKARQAEIGDIARGVRAILNSPRRALGERRSALTLPGFSCKLPPAPAAGGAWRPTGALRKRAEAMARRRPLTRLPPARGASRESAAAPAMSAGSGPPTEGAPNTCRAGRTPGAAPADWWNTKAHDSMTRAAIAAGLALGLLATGAFAAGDPAAGKLKAAVCSACHGADGNSVDPVWPKLAGQGASYQMRQILAIRSEHGRANPEAATMVPMIANLSDQDLEDISAYFATVAPTVEAADPDLAEAGRRLYQAGDAKRNIPSCMSCHGPGGRGNRLAAFPALGGQHAAYSAKQLRAYREGSRTTDPAEMMRSIAGRLTDADIEAVSEYLSGLHQAGG